MTLRNRLVFISNWDTVWFYIRVPKPRERDVWHWIKTNEWTCDVSQWNTDPRLFHWNYFKIQRGSRSDSEIRLLREKKTHCCLSFPLCFPVQFYFKSLSLYPSLFLSISLALSLSLCLSLSISLPIPVFLSLHPCPPLSPDEWTSLELPQLDVGGTEPPWELDSIIIIIIILTNVYKGFFSFININVHLDVLMRVCIVISSHYL